MWENPETNKWNHRSCKKTPNWNWDHHKQRDKWIKDTKIENIKEEIIHNMENLWKRLKQKYKIKCKAIPAE
jgi:hypothetical protein